MNTHTLLNGIAVMIFLGCGTSQRPITPGTFQSCLIEKRSTADLAQQEIQMKWICPDTRGIWELTVHCDGDDLIIDGASAKKISGRSSANSPLKMQFMPKTHLSCPSGWSIKSNDPNEDNPYADRGNLRDEDVNFKK